MSVAKRAWQGHIYKDGTEVGFAEGTFSVDRGLVTRYGLGTYDVVARREVSREITGSIDHGYLSKALFMAVATGANLTTFQIKASTADGGIYFSGCSMETYDFDIPTDGWITESIAFRALKFA